MSQYVVDGGKRLEGELQIDGSKNAVLPIMAATLLCEGTTCLENCPKITDVMIMSALLEELGCHVYWQEKTLCIDAHCIKDYRISENLVRRMRSSIILLGALLGRVKQAEMSAPGGCQLGARPIDLHLAALRKMGAEIHESSDIICCKASNLQGATIHLKFPSVGATENIMLAAARSEGVTIIYNPAREPEIVDLQNFLVTAGAKITGAGTQVIQIQGVKELKSISYRVIPDRIIAGTYLAAAAITRGHICLNQVNPDHLLSVIDVFRELGCKVITQKDRIEMITPEHLSGAKITTSPYPGFPTDMQSQMLALLCTCDQPSTVTETLFESRFKTAGELQKMGANIQICESVAEIIPQKHLIGCEVEARDLRGGAALVLAGLVAEGTTIIEGVTHIKRGYAQLDVDLARIGAKIKEIN